MPYSVDELVSVDEEGFASIYLNARHSYEKQKKSLRHALRHLAGDDFYNDKDIHTIEAQADGIQEIQQSRPNIIKAKDLLPSPSQPKPKIKLTAHQLVALRKCISELDTFAFDDRNRY